MPPENVHRRREPPFYSDGKNLVLYFQFTNSSSQNNSELE
jgi:hypothetical protein